MRTAAATLSAYIAAVVSAIGFEGWFIALGTLLLAVASSFISPAGPWAVTGIVALALGLAFARGAS